MNFCPKSTRFAIRILLALGLLVCVPIGTLLPQFAGIARAANFTFDGGIGGAWQTLNNWSPDLMGTEWDNLGPNAGNEFTIGSGFTAATSSNSVTPFDAKLTVAAGGTLRSNGAAHAGNLVLAGGTLTKTSSSSTHSFNGNISVIADSFITFPGANTLFIDSNISGSGRIQAENEVGAFEFRGNNSGFSGGWLVNDGVVRFNSLATLGTGTIESSGTALTGNDSRARLNANTAWTITNSLAGDNIIEIGATASASRSLTLDGTNGSTIKPGKSPANPGDLSVGILNLRSSHDSITGNVTLSNNAQVVIDVVGTGGIAGTDFDQLLLGSVDLSKGNSSFLGLANGKLHVNFDTGLTLSGLQSQGEITIVSLTEGNLSDQFLPTNVTFSGGIEATVNYYDNAATGNGTARITLSNFQAVPEPSTCLLLVIGGGIALIRVRGHARCRVRTAQK